MMIFFVSKALIVCRKSSMWSRWRWKIENFTIFFICTNWIKISEPKKNLSSFLSSLVSKYKRNVFEESDGKGNNKIDSLSWRFCGKPLYLSIWKEHQQSAKHQNLSNSLGSFRLRHNKLFSKHEEVVWHHLRND